jgi:hypothetical protein
MNLPLTKDIMGRIMSEGLRPEMLEFSNIYRNSQGNSGCSINFGQGIISPTPINNSNIGVAHNPLLTGLGTA